MTAPLETGKSYWLVETRAPAGHALLPRAVAFHIEVGADVDATTVIKTDFGADEGFSSVRVLPASGSLPGDRTPGIRVVDTQVGVLPKAGSIGIYPQLAGGAALLGLAGACALAAPAGTGRVTYAASRRGLVTHAARCYDVGGAARLPNFLSGCPVVPH